MKEYKQRIVIFHAHWQHELLQSNISKVENCETSIDGPFVNVLNRAAYLNKIFFRNDGGGGVGQGSGVGVEGYSKMLPLVQGHICDIIMFLVNLAKLEVAH